MYKYKMIACDLDGTLLGSDCSVSRENKEAIKKLCEKGVLFVPCSGRTLSEMKEVSEIPPFYKEIDVGKVSKVIDDTTNTLYSENRYIELTQEQIDEIQQTEK